MIKGAKRWKKVYHKQTDNAIEEILRKFNQPSLETCGAAAAVNCMDAIGIDLSIETPTGYKIDADEAITLFLNDKRNYDLLYQARNNLDPGELQNTRVPQHIPVAVKVLFNCKAEFNWGIDIKRYIQELKKGNSIQVCLSIGHYISIIAYDTCTDEFIYNDSWPNRKSLQNKGIRERIKSDFLSSIINPYYIIYKE